MSDINDRESPMSLNIEVICEDGQVRHPQPFADWPQARAFAEWGHCCTNRHAIREASTHHRHHSGDLCSDECWNTPDQLTLL